MKRSRASAGIVRMALWFLLTGMFFPPLALAGSGHFPAPVQTDRICDYFGAFKIYGVNAQIGDEVAFYDPNGVICGVYKVDTAGEYGIIHVYGDDPNTAGVDEGAVEGDVLTVKVWDDSEGVEVSGSDLALSPGTPPAGSSFVPASVPPVWQHQDGFVLNMDTATHFAKPVPTPLVCNYIGSLVISGVSASIGDEVAVFDPAGVLCGQVRVTSPGQYGVVQIYGDDVNTGVDEGAVEGDLLTFKIWDRSAGLEFEGAKVLYTAGSAVGAFIPSSIPPIWSKDAGYVLDLEIVKDSYTVTFSAGANGGLTGETTQTVIHGGACTAVTAVADAGCHFTGWTGGHTGTENPLTVGNVTSAMAITANFAINTYSVTFSAGANGGVTGDTTQTVSHGGSGTAVTAVADAGYHFTGWTGGHTGTENPLTVGNVTSAMAITANFAVNTYSVTFSAGANGGLTGETTQTVSHGGSGTAVTAVADAGYHFTGWTGGHTGTENPLTVGNVTSAMAITANFAINTYAVTFSAGANGGVTGETAQTVSYGGSSTAVTADADAGYHFTGWTGDYTGTENPLTVDNVTSAMAITANFAINLQPGSYYVNIGSGDDTSDGSQSTPWKTFHHAVFKINMGNPGTYTLYVAAGLYSVAGGEADEILILSQDNVRIIGQEGPNGERPALDATASTDWGDWGIAIGGIDIVFQDVDTNGFMIGLAVGLGQLNGGSAADTVSIRRCNILNSYIGIWVDSSQNVTIENCVQSFASMGIAVCNCDPSILKNSLFSNLYGGIVIINGSPLVSRNTIVDSMFGIAVTAGGSSGLGAAGLSTASPLIQNNIITAGAAGLSGYGIKIASESGGAAAPVIHHNTIDLAGGQTDSVGIEIMNDASSSQPVIQYNIIISSALYGVFNDPSYPGTPVIDYNDVWGNGTDYEGCSKGPNDISADPLYDQNHNLQVGSPCMDAIPANDPDPVKIDLKGYVRPKGAGYDMGASEFIPDVIFNYSLPGGTGLPADYRMFTVPVDLGTGAELQAAMEKKLGLYDNTLWRIFAWNGSGYDEMTEANFSTTPVVPGRAFWIISIDSPTVPFEGAPSPDGGVFNMDLKPGWNMFALPWPGADIALDKIGITVDGVNTCSVTDSGNLLTEQWVWGYENGYIQLQAGAVLEAGKGYWIKVVAGSNVKMLIPPNNTGGYFSIQSFGSFRRLVATSSAEEPPPPPQ